MSKQPRRIAETAGSRRMGVFSPVNGGNGHNGGSGLLSWYFAQPRVDGLRYVLTANGYLVMPAGPVGSGREVDTEELIEQNYQ